VELTDLLEKKKLKLNSFEQWRIFWESVFHIHRTYYNQKHVWRNWLTGKIEQEWVPWHNESRYILRVMLHVIPMSFLYPSKNEVAFKITIELMIDQN
jgi:hypothetical protein